MQATGLGDLLGLGSQLHAEGLVFDALNAMDPALPERIAFDSEHDDLVVRCERDAARAGAVLATLIGLSPTP